MGVDYRGVGGVGVEFTESMLEKAIGLGIFTKEDWIDDRYDCMEKIGLIYSESGNAYTGDIRFHLFVEGDTLKEINDNAESFVAAISRLKPDVSVDTLEIIEDLHIW